MKKFGLFLLVFCFLIILGALTFIAFWDMPIAIVDESQDVTKELADDKIKN